ncbi:SDR family oxidoreductase, partial [Pseudomonas sp.]|uniref:SDR family oxidoreductase n=1 Tax=Pseudomonas sp. TaxID=306 RepID=UPI00262EFE67
MNTLFSLKGKVVLVTGASSGLGEHFAHVVSGAGAKVVIAARRVERLQALADQLRSQGGEVIAVALDVTSRASVEAAFDLAQQAFGVVDVVINNAGV